MIHNINKDKPNVLVLASTFPRWKDDTTPPFVFELEKRLTRRFNIAVLAPHYKGAKTKENLSGLEVRRFKYMPDDLEVLTGNGGIMSNIKKDKWKILLAFPFFFSEIFHSIMLLREKRVSLVHAHWLIPQGIIAYIIFKLLKVPYIVTSHGSDVFALNNPVLHNIKESILSNSLEITVVSSVLKEYLLANYKNISKISIAPMGVDSGLFDPTKYNKSIRNRYGINGIFLLFVGRLEDVKGIQYIIEALPRIVNKYEDTKLLIVGEGDYAGNLKGLVKKLKLDKHIVFAGPLPNNVLPEYFATADFFISPSIQNSRGQKEGFGLTIVEASMSGCIPITTDAGGSVDIVQDKVNGFMIPEKDPQSLAKLIIRLEEHKKSLSKIKKAARISSVKRYDWAVVAKNYENIYLENIKK